jgi:RNA polymerase sigma-70 factor (ECF subfamily)
VLGWVLTIAHHALVDHVRRDRSHPSLDAVDSRYVQGHDDPLDRLIQGEQAEALRELMVSLDPATRSLFDLRYTMDMTYREIAGLFEISEDSVKQRFSRAHRRLRATLEKVRDSHDT